MRADRVVADRRRRSRSRRARPSVPAMFVVPASNLNGSGAYVVFSKVTALDHVAAALVGRHRVEDLFPPPEHADPRRPEQLVARKRRRSRSRGR